MCTESIIPAPEALVSLQLAAGVPEIEADAVKLADSADLANAEATIEVPTEAELYAEIAKLWAANKVNRYDLGEKLWQLKQQAKHGEWMMKVQQMGIPHRTITSLITHYREEFALRNTAPITDADFVDFDLPASGDSEDEQQEERPAPERKKASRFRPMIVLKWGEEETAWKHAIEVIIAQEGIHNPTEAAFFAVVEVAKEFERRAAAEIEAIGVGSPSVVSQVEPPETASSVALVAVAPPLGPEDEIEAVPVPISDVRCSPRRRLVFPEDEDVQ